MYRKLIAMSLLVFSSVGYANDASVLDGVSIFEGGERPTILKNKLSGGIVGGSVVNEKIHQILTSNGVSMGGFLPEMFSVKAYTRIYSDKEGSFDTGSYFIRDIKPDTVVMHRIPVSEELLLASQKPLTKMDGAIVEHGANLAASLGSSSPGLAGLAIGLVANIATNAFATRGLNDEAINKGNRNVTAESCGQDCAITHHEVTIVFLHGSNRSKAYSLTARKTLDKVDPTMMAPLANMALELMMNKVAQIAAPKDQPVASSAAAPESDNSNVSSTPDDPFAHLNY